jgi:hypothetical protein
MLGELTAKMAEAVAKSRARKLLLPLSLDDVSVIGHQGGPLSYLTDKLVQEIKEMMKGNGAISCAKQMPTLKPAELKSFIWNR